MFAPNMNIQLSLRNTCVSLKKTIYVISTIFGHCFIVRIVLVLEGILPANHTFQCGE
jgi:hypothetical protein